MSRYRCPQCSIFAIETNRIFDGRIMFACSKCEICAITPMVGNIEETYLEFLDMYDNNKVTNIKDLNNLMEQEKVLRSQKDIREMLVKNNAHNDELLKSILFSKHDYIVDYRLVQDPEPELGSRIEETPLDYSLIKKLLERKIERLYKFQQIAIEKILAGKDTIISAPTASGKTEAFCIPILQKISEQISHFGSLRSASSKKTSAIFVYPTKALSRDQLPKVKDLAETIGISVDLLDGDTSEQERTKILDFPPDIIITNFDILHYHLLHRTKFSRVLRNAQFLVVDEAHVYTGILGANVHHIIKRLERIVINKKLQIVAASATLPNADQFCQILFGRKMELIRGSGRRGTINFVILFPSLRTNRSLMLDLIKQTTKRNHKTIAFSNSHIGSELLAFYGTRQGISIQVHRAGLLPGVRKSAESLFKSGKVMALSATPTLELGIDIGDVDAIASSIVPINRLVQRFGRAARRGQHGYAFLALGNDPISQYYRMHPDDFLHDQEQAYTDPSNPFVMEHQVLAMACDKPLSLQEAKPVTRIIQDLKAKGLVEVTGQRIVPIMRKAIQVINQYNIRGIGKKIDIILDGKVIGDRALPNALEELHPGAIYFISGKRYQVQNLYFEDKSQPFAEIVQIPRDYPYYTKAIVDEWPDIVEIYEKRKVFGIEAAYCSLKIKKRVLGYSNIEIGKEIAQGQKVFLEYPIEFEFITKGFVFKAPKPINSLTKDISFDKQYIEMSSYHASEHVIIEGSTMITGGASQDLGGISLGSSGFIFIYDGSIGGNGASRSLFDRLDKAVARALSILSECPCKSPEGCPRCTFSYRCGNNNEWLYKTGAIEVLDKIAKGEQTELQEQVYGDRALV